VATSVEGVGALDDFVVKAADGSYPVPQGW
jgi:hypothetical protein